jgi:acyl-CoA hydrolase
MTVWCDVQSAVQVVESGDRVFVQGACATPTALIEALVARGEELRAVEITHVHTYGPTPYTDERGRPIIALPATAHAQHKGGSRATESLPEPVDGLISRLVPVLSPGAAVTTSRAHVHYVVTEYGIAALHGRDLAERARSLIAIAAPQFREALERRARALYLLP